MIKQSVLVIGLVLLLLSTGGCGPNTPLVTPSPTAGIALAQENPPTINVTAHPSVTPGRVTTATPVPTISPSPTPPPTSLPSSTPIPSATATTSPTPYPFAQLDPSLPTPATAVPTPVPPFEQPPEVTNILLLGNDVEWRQGGRTDTLIIVSINHETGTANLLSIPRDLYVYIPGWKMERINLALPHGHGVDYPGGGGQLIKDTILYNLGIPIDYYARIGFNGFKDAVNALGGIEVAVSCPLSDWRLKEPELDPNVEENWEIFDLEPGVYEMDGDLALWYARSRRTTNDFERSRRQQQVLRAMLNQGIDLDLLSRAPELWETYRETVETDLTLPVMLQLAALAPAVRANGIHNDYLSYGPVRAWQEPESGSSVQLLQWEQAEPVLAALMQPPVLNRASRAPITVEVVSVENYIMYLLAADNLAWHGFVPVYGGSTGTTPDHTEITYYGDNSKGSFDWLLSWVFDQEREEITLAPAGSGEAANYRVVLGYDYDPCRPELEAPRGP